MPLAQGTLSLRVSSLKWLGEMLPSGMKPEEAAPFVTVHFERRGEQPLEVLRTIRKVFHNHVRPGELLRLGKLAKMKLDNRWELYDEVLVAHEVTAFIVCVRGTAGLSAQSDKARSYHEVMLTRCLVSANTSQW